MCEFKMGDKVKWKNSSSKSIYEIEHIDTNSIYKFLKFKCSNHYFNPQNFELVESVEESLKEKDCKKAIAEKILVLYDERVKKLAFNSGVTEQEVVTQFTSNLQDFNDIVRILGYKISHRMTYELTEI